MKLIIRASHQSEMTITCTSITISDATYPNDPKAKGVYIHADGIKGHRDVFIASYPAGTAKLTLLDENTFLLETNKLFLNAHIKEFAD